MREYQKDDRRNLSSFDKTRYSTFKVEVLEFSWMWNNAFCEMTIVVKYVLTDIGEKPYSCEWVPTLSSFDKTRYSTFKVEELEFSWMWNNAFCEMTIVVKYVHTHTGEKPYECETVPLLSSFDKTRYSTLKVEALEFSWMCNNAFCEMTIVVK